jgi:ABC-2 type transport system ATP-binding protein
MDSVLAVQNLSVKYGALRAVDDVSFSVGEGEIFGLLGPNGAGKTTALSAIEGLLPMAGGAVSIAGFSVATAPLDARANVGLQLQTTSFHRDLPIVEIVRLYAALYGAPLNAAAIDAKLKTAGLFDERSRVARKLSGGQQQRLSLLIAMLHEPPLVLLDEPTEGLDPQSRRALWERIESFRNEGRSVVITTHSMDEAEALCDRIAIINHGKIVAAGTPTALVAEHKQDASVRAVSRGKAVSLEDVFIGLTDQASA